MAVAGELRFEFKNKTAFTASPCIRLLICCNYTEDSSSVIPVTSFTFTIFCNSSISLWSLVLGLHSCDVP